MSTRWFFSSARVGAGASATGQALPTAVRFNRDIEGRREEPPPVTGPTLSLVGPGDVLGFDRGMVLREEPPPGTPDAAENVLATVELAHADLPWLLSPGTAPTGSGQPTPQPWLVLIVLAEDEAAVPRDARPLPVLTAPVAALPPLAERWAWAHVEARLPDTVTDGPGAKRLVEQGARNHSADVVARLMCPRRLLPNRGWIAAVVPATAAGRDAGLRVSPVGAATVDAWPVPGRDTVDLPVYHWWTFRTGQAGTFEELARRLRFRPAAEAGLGTRIIDVGKPWPAEESPGPATVPMDGALRAPGTAAPETWSDPTAQERFRGLLRERVDAPARQREEAVDDQDIVAVGPPLYGSHHTGEQTVPAEPESWLSTLNLEVRRRVAAALGTRYVQLEQEFLMARAWEQVGEIRQANRLLAAGELAAAAAERAQHKHLDALGVADLVTVMAPVGGRMSLTAAPPEAKTLSAMLAATDKVPTGAAGTSFARLIRSGGALSRRARRGVDGEVPDEERPEPVLLRGLQAMDLDVDGLSGELRDRISPTRLQILRMTDRVPGDFWAERTQDDARPLRPIMAHPKFTVPIAEELLARWPEWALPGISALPPDSVTLLETNPEFIAALLVGLNHEFNRELLWREFPTDQRGTPSPGSGRATARMSRRSPCGRARPRWAASCAPAARATWCCSYAGSCCTASPVPPCSRYAAWRASCPRRSTECRPPRSRWTSPPCSTCSPVSTRNEPAPRTSSSCSANRCAGPSSDSTPVTSPPRWSPGRTSPGTASTWRAAGSSPWARPPPPPPRRPISRCGAGTRPTWPVSPSNAPSSWPSRPPRCWAAEHRTEDRSTPAMNDAFAARAQVDRARTEADAAQALADEQQAVVRRLQDHIRAGLPDPLHIQGQRPSPELLAEAEAALLELRRRADELNALVAGAEEELTRALGEGTALFPDDNTAPIALLPVRVETIWWEPRTLRVRIYPDDILLTAFDPRLTPAEAAAAAAYWRNPGPQAWQQLLTELRPARASWAVRAARPGAPPPTIRTDDPSQHRPQTVAMPKRWRFLGLLDGQVVVDKLGRPVPDPLPIGLLRAEEEGWETDWFEAVKAGMGIELVFPPENTEQLDELLVVGVRDDSAAAGALRLRDLLHGHRFGGGLGLLPSGTATNNTPRTRSGWSSAPAYPGPDPDLEAGQRPVADTLATGLGLPDADFLRGCSGAADTEPSAVAALTLLTWPTLGKGFAEAALSTLDLGTRQVTGVAPAGRGARSASTSPSMCAVAGRWRCCGSGASPTESFPPPRWTTGAPNASATWTS